jgi:hypothetical protein
VRKPFSKEAGVVLALSTGWWLGSILLFILWVAIAFWPARVARRKGHSFFLYFLFSLICFPLALLIAYLIHDRRR